ncbi:hypothetical protein AB870_02160 [Pandoraea faecigallinarum]|uniref:Uncharacterized protein n=1 Tax=Pandoraea faecigallinarum TaxID=656179 RepID=A0A0H3WMQ9_9BURK|nr:hypothetical protein AB870_02160 [Pandoraea faecigallinarum]
MLRFGGGFEASEACSSTAFAEILVPMTGKVKCLMSYIRLGHDDVAMRTAILLRREARCAAQCPAHMGLVGEAALDGDDAERRLARLTGR